ncbi:DUF4352 domain-containing protein [Cohnella sp. AR92]|uniref:stalk domain-containing protein n=1 Tax=Cohnella sp. AR92 TaxID=648716 RepID=UPI000F8E2E44|nr:DUF4352 domain-containing protein [Cohnella sp. AR92]RUS48386.1 DUF4352 domain-containing protein [Cohnella sp. AR92]
MKKKVLIMLVIGSLMLLSAGIGAYAASKMTLIVNGKVASAEPKVINGTTYVPLRAAAELLNATVGYDKGTNTVTITSKADTSRNNSTAGGPNQPSQSASQLGFSRKNPAPIGTTLSFDQSGILEKYSGEMTLEEVIRGQEANDLVADANMFNDEPDAGYEYLLAKIHVKITKNNKSDAAVDINTAQFTLVSSDGKDYSRGLVVPPDPDLNANLYEGASASGWVAFQVKTTDASPLITFGRKYDGTGGLWFKP